MDNFCQNCGFQLPTEAASFCGNCGNDLRHESTPLQATPRAPADPVEPTGTTQQPAPAELDPPQSRIPVQTTSKASETAYRLSKWKSWLTALFVIQAVAASWAVLALTSRISLIDELSPRGGSLRLGDLTAMQLADNDVSLTLKWYFFAAFATFPVLVMWSWRVSKNTHLWASPRHSNGWAIGGWFCPLANFIVPYRVLKDGWNLTPSLFVAGETKMTVNDKPTGGQKLTELLFGWVIWWAGAIFYTYGRSTDAKSFNAVQEQDLALAIGFGAAGIACVCLLVAVRRISARQDEFSTLRHFA